MINQTQEELLDQLCAAHEAIFRKNPKAEIFLTCMVTRRDGTGDFVALPDAPRDFALATLRHHMANPDVVRYAMWHEAWVLVAKGPDAKSAAYAAAHAGRIHEHPDRKEVVYTLVVDRDGAKVGASQRIIRDARGRVIRLERERFGLEPDRIGGAFANLFPQPIHPTVQ